MEHLTELLGMLLHLDKSLGAVIAQYGNWVYVILAAIVFCETGLVVLPFLPGDSLLFIAGAFSAGGAIHPVLLVALLVAAAVIGNTVNYTLGRWTGFKIYEHPSRWIDRQALRRTHDFYERHGGKMLVAARFIPVVRTFAPFVAGVSQMDMRRFQLFNIAGALLWVVGLVSLGYFFGNLPFVREHLSTIALVGVCAAVGPLLLAGLWKLVRRA